MMRLVLNPVRWLNAGGSYCPFALGWSHVWTYWRELAHPETGTLPSARLGQQWVDCAKCNTRGQVSTSLSC